MRPRAEAFERARLALVLVVLCAALAVPTAVLVVRAYGQLELEAFHDLRERTEALTWRIDTALAGQVASLDAHTVGDFAFRLVDVDVDVDGGRGRSPLAAWPAPAYLPGTVGYFQVDADGRFSTPSVPGPGADPALPVAEREAREARAAEIRAILARNRLVDARPSVRPELPGITPPSFSERRVGGIVGRAGTRFGGDADAYVADASEAEVAEAPAPVDDETVSAPAPAQAPPGKTARVEQRDPATGPAAGTRYGQAAFDRLSESRPDRESMRTKARRETVATLDLDTRLESRALEAQSEDDGTDAARPVPVEASRPARVDTFAADVQAYEFGRLGEGYAVLFRNVWRDGQRYVQGVLVDETEFVTGAIAREFRLDAVSRRTDLVVTSSMGAIARLEGEPPRRGDPDPDGTDTLILERALSAPFDGLALVYVADGLAPGPGARLLAWTTGVIAFVLVTGFVLLYRLGAEQIALKHRERAFVAAVSHELKTPLTSIRMYAEMLSQGWVDEGRRAQYHAFIRSESERLSRLIGNVLELARLGRGETPPPTLECVSAGDLLALAERAMRDTVARAGFDAATSLAPAAAGARAEIDRDALTQICLNLADNAVKFSAPTGARRLDVAVRADPSGRIELTVRDFGPGIAEAERDRVFRPFYRGEAVSMSTPGTGIGLAVVGALAATMGAGIDVVAAAPGTEFSVVFPVPAGIGTAGESA